jgi:hypothetical protein
VLQIVESSSFSSVASSSSSDLRHIHSRVSHYPPQTPTTMKLSIVLSSWLAGSALALDAVEGSWCAKDKTNVCHQAGAEGCINDKCVNASYSMNCVDACYYQHWQQYTGPKWLYRLYTDSQL